MRVVCKVSEDFGPVDPGAVKRSASLRHDCSKVANSALVGSFGAHAGDSTPDRPVRLAVIRLFSLPLVNFDLQKYVAHPKDNLCCLPSVNQSAGQDWGRIGESTDQSGQIGGAILVGPDGWHPCRKNPWSAVQIGGGFWAKLTD
jgi:hypothetical protein